MAVPKNVNTKISNSYIEIGSRDSVKQVTQIDGDGNIVNTSPLDVVDQIDTTPLLDVSSTNIPASSGVPVTIVASLASAVESVAVICDIGEYIGLYSDPSGTPVLECILPLGGGEIPVILPAGTEIGLRNMKDAAITSDYISINFLGKVPWA